MKPAVPYKTKPRFRTADEFEAWYAANAKMTVAEWRRVAGDDRYPKRCRCGDDLCTGWQMAHHCDEPTYRTPASQSVKENET